MESQLNRIATSKQGKICQIVQSISNPQQNAGNTELFDYDRFDYKRLAQELSNVLDGTSVNMDGVKVGDLITPRIDNNLGRKITIIERGGTM